MSRADIDALVAFKSQAAERQRKAKLSRAYELAEVSAPLAATGEPGRGSALRVECATTINALEPDEWNALLGHRGTMNHSTLMTLERIFRDQAKPESNWNWHYFVVRDGERPVAATFFTDSLWKDDMLMRAEVSNRMEALRESSSCC
jgi:hypothetical protein